MTCVSSAQLLVACPPLGDYTGADARARVPGLTTAMGAFERQRRSRRGLGRRAPSGSPDTAPQAVVAVPADHNGGAHGCPSGTGRTGLHGPARGAPAASGRPPRRRARGCERATGGDTDVIGILVSSPVDQSGSGVRSRRVVDAAGEGRA
jgi:hypothetical protein